MFERRRRSRLAQESLDEFAIECQSKRQHLDGDLALELPLSGAVHDTHAAPSKLLEYLVLVVEARADKIEIGNLELSPRFP